MSNDPRTSKFPNNFNADHSDRPFGRDIYFQATDFTCGPACLMMAMAALDEGYIPNHLDELVIWREANLVMQGAPPAGCGPYGLARAAIRRGFDVEVYEHKARNIIVELSKRPEEVPILETITRHDRSHAIKEGCRIHEAPLSRELISGLIERGRQIIALTFEFVDGHWVIVHDIVGKNVFIIDPNKASAEELEKHQFTTDTGRNFIHYTDAERWMSYGPDRSSVLIAIGRSGDIQAGTAE
jgi:hypothetical protein